MSKRSHRSVNLSAAHFIAGNRTKVRCPESSSAAHCAGQRKDIRICVFLHSAGTNVKPKSYSFCNLLALRQATRQTTQFYESYFEAIGLRATQFAILERIDESGPISINDLAQALVMDAATMGRSLKPLERDGYVVIAAGRDGRTRALTLSAAGSAKLKEAWSAWHKATAAFEQRVGGAETSSTLRKALRHVTTALNEGKG